MTTTPTPTAASFLYDAPGDGVNKDLLAALRDKGTADEYLDAVYLRRKRLTWPLIGSGLFFRCRYELFVPKYFSAEGRLPPQGRRRQALCGNRGYIRLAFGPFDDE
jgi:hypothetical protein